MNVIRPARESTAGGPVSHPEAQEAVGLLEEKVHHLNSSAEHGPSEVARI